jgi:hypothetical protein
MSPKSQTLFILFRDLKKNNKREQTDRSQKDMRSIFLYEQQLKIKSKNNEVSRPALS